ncbi:ATP-grasp domain-containing protein [Thermoactinomyces mirandus]|uniref:ATP-grasp domain-containing protein n=1 Tax=Thermoactinomyces mirandus TaxID=2756294 RepID=A0A7W1XU44_9BACL|nr:ATP-grasp domain-containing protein [Thermoactinomyces mirandus]MBA4603314.1 ATP-grasp domain-containing protein [Thermoactinomyces mirandus]
MKTLLLVKSGWPLPLRLPAYRHFFRKGWEVAVVDSLLNQSLQIADISICAELNDPDEVYFAVMKKIKRKPDAILTMNDSGLVLAATLAKRIGLPFLEIEKAKNVIQKTKQREAFKQSGMPTPCWKKVHSSEEVVKMLKEWGELVIKPVDRSAGAAVKWLKNEIDADRYFQEALNESPTKRVMIEEFLEGPEISVEMVFADGQYHVVCIIDKTVTSGPYFIELGHTVPSNHPLDYLEKAGEAALMACQALGLNWGICHIEIKLTEQGPVVVEVNPRVPGGCIPELINRALGINLYDLALRQATGEMLTLEDLQPIRRKGAAIRYLLSPGGIFIGASSPWTSQPPHGLVELSVLVEPGSNLPIPSSNAGRIAYAIAERQTAKEAEVLAEEAIRSIVVQTK